MSHPTLTREPCTTSPWCDDDVCRCVEYRESEPDSLLKQIADLHAKQAAVMLDSMK